MYNCILVSLDGSLEAEAVLPEVEKLLKVNPAKVILLRVAPYVDVDAQVQKVAQENRGTVTWPNELYELLSQANEAQHRRYLDAVARRLIETTGATVVTEVSFSEPVDEIVFFARIYKVDLIAMATHGRTGLNRLLYGSVTESVLHHTPCPMLVVRTPDTPLPRYVDDYQEEPVH